MSKRTWKLQQIQAHDGDTNCLSIGYRSGKVMATGGDDKKVNLWALGKSFCIMSLKGHTSGVDSVRFNGAEDTVAAGSQSGAVKIWNLEASKILRTLSGHKSTVKALDFHPFADIVVSGSADTNIKLWDYRKKGCIFTYKGHTGGVNCLRFSPDGKWIASAGDDGCARLWDMATGKEMGEFKHASGIVSCLTFHPVDFLLATAGSDRTVKYWDLETLGLVSTTEGDSAPIRNVIIHPEGWGAYAACQDYLKVYGWEPAVCYDSVNVGWGKPTDIVVYQNQLIGASIQKSTVQIFMTDLTKLNYSFSDATKDVDQSSNPFTLNPSRRRSFITKTQNPTRVEGGGGERVAEKAVAGKVEYSDVFNPKKELSRDPDKSFSNPMPSTEERSPSKPRQPSPTLSAGSNRTHHRSHSQQNKKQQAPKQPTLFEPIKSKRLQGHQKNRDSPRSKPTIASKQPAATTTAANDFNVFDLTLQSPQVSPFKQMNHKSITPSIQPHHGQAFEPHQRIQSPNNLSWNTSSQPATLPSPLNPHSFSPPNQQADELSDDKSISCIRSGHLVILNVLSNRHSSLQVFKSLWVAGNVKMALDSAVNMNDTSVLQDIVSLLLQTPTLWTLDICTCILPVLSNLVLSRYEAYATTALSAVKFILRNFSTLIKDSLSNISSIGVDITKEERYNKSLRCYQMLRDIQSSIDGRFCASSCTGVQGVDLREIKLLLAQLG